MESIPVDVDDVFVYMIKVNPPFFYSIRNALVKVNFSTCVNFTSLLRSMGSFNLDAQVGILFTTTHWRL